jgi:hypothetical protein
MKNNQKKTMRLSSLKKGKVKRIGLFEKLGLKIAGYTDGKRNLPRDGVSGWMSPHLDKEIRSYDEFASRMWGRLQVEEEESYARLGELMDSIAHTKSLLDAAKSALAGADTKEKSTDNSRKKGEGKLTDAQVSARRFNEKAKRLVPLKGRLNSIQSKLSAEIDEFFQLRNKIIEDNNSTRMICNRVRDHIYQRLDIYWNATLRKHSEKEKMPVVPLIEINSRSETVYMEPHKILMQKAETFSKELSNDEETEEEAA